MTAATTPEQREYIRKSSKWDIDNPRGCDVVTLQRARMMLRLLDERDALAAEVARLRANGKIVRERYAISHAPKGVKGGPWESLDGPDGTPTHDLRRAISWSNRIDPARWIVESDKMPPSAHAVRVVTRRKKDEK